MKLLFCETIFFCASFYVCNRKTRQGQTTGVVPVKSSVPVKAFVIVSSVFGHMVVPILLFVTPTSPVLDNGVSARNPDILSNASLPNIKKLPLTVVRAENPDIVVKLPVSPIIKVPTVVSDSKPDIVCNI